MVLAGAQIPAECGTVSRTQQITRKRTHKRLDLQGQKSILAITPPGRPFLLITRKEIARSAKSREQERVNELRWKTGANPSKSRRGPRRDGPGLPPRSLLRARSLNWAMRPCRSRVINALFLPARAFRAGGLEKWFSVKLFGKCFFLKSLLHLTEFKVNCNAGNGKRVSLAESPGVWLRKLFGRRRGQGQAGHVRPHVSFLSVVPL